MLRDECHLQPMPIMISLEEATPTLAGTVHVESQLKEAPSMGNHSPGAAAALPGSVR